VSLQSYWDDFYANLKLPELESPSPFAHFLMTKIKVSEFTVIDWGAGNGRDSFLFAQYSKLVLAVDASSKALESISFQIEKRDIENLFALNTFEIATFPPFLLREKAPIIHYSRFLFHSLDDPSLEEYLSFIATFSKPGDLIAAEYRSATSANVSYEFPSHERFYRDKFMIASKVKGEIQSELIFEFEGTGLANYKSEDPLITRQIWEISK
jgi:hypothetical protein